MGGTAKSKNDIVQAVFDELNPRFLLIFKGIRATGGKP
jgi:molybdopterin biosynthesis enzyme